MINLTISSVSSINGFSGTVSLSAGNSYGVTATFSPSSGTPPFTPDFRSNESKRFTFIWVKKLVCF